MLHKKISWFQANILRGKKTYATGKHVNNCLKFDSQSTYTVTLHNKQKLDVSEHHEQPQNKTTLKFQELKFDNDRLIKSAEKNEI